MVELLKKCPAYTDYIRDCGAKRQRVDAGHRLHGFAYSNLPEVDEGTGDKRYTECKEGCQCPRRPR